MLHVPVPPPARLGRNIENVKAHNLRAVLLTLLYHGPISRVHIAQRTGLSTTTITNLVNELLAQGIVYEAEREAPGRGRRATNPMNAGRPATPVGLVPGARSAIGIHFGVDTLRAGVVDLFGTLNCYRVVRHPTDAPASRVLEQAVALAEEVIVAGCVQRESLVGVGVGASGLVDPETGVNVLAPNLGWRDVPIRDILANQLHLPVFVDNNVRAMALAEGLFGAGKGINTLAFVYGRVGVGAGFVVNGQVYRGSKAGAGEIGHTTVIPAGGAPCRCGNTGCLETLVSEPEIVQRAQALAERAPDSLLATLLNNPATSGQTTPEYSGAALIEQVFAAARGGDRNAQMLLNERADYMGMALANLVNLVNPDMIILGGLFAAGHDVLLPQIEETMRRRSFAGLGQKVALRVTTFGRQAGVIGAGALALDAFFYRQDSLLDA